MSGAHVVSIAERRRSGPPATDAELMAAIATGDLAPLGVLYDRYHEAVRHFVLRATSQSGDADDLVHETFLTAIRVAPTYDGRESARPLLIGIAAQLVRRRRQTFARLGRALSAFADTVIGSVQQTPEIALREARDLDLVDDALGRMNEGRRLVLLMIVREGLSGEEVAKALGIPVATVWTRLHYARAELREIAIKRGNR